MAILSLALLSKQTSLYIESCKNMAIFLLFERIW
jgi:hypothetical protein